MVSDAQELWCAVIQTAIDDLSAPPPTWRQGYNEWQKNQREARLFLTKSGGEWARSRETICSAAGVDPDALRDKILRQLEGEETADGQCDLPSLQGGSS